MNTKDLVKWDQQHFIHPTTSIQEQQAKGAKVIFEKGQGIYLTSTEGKVYIDAMSSLWNVNIGHGRKELGEVAKEQMEQLAYSSCFSTFSNEPAILLTKKIAELAPPSLNAVFLTSGGSESNDTAIKLIRHYWRIQGKPEKNKIVAMNRGYHGVSAGATSATGIPEFWDMAGVTMEGFVHAKSPYEIGTAASIQSIRETIEKEGPETIAAFMTEPIQGAGGVLIPPDDFLIEVRKLCDEYGILMHVDEVITGFGRTGKMFAVEHYGVEPDLLAFAKGVTSGYFPLGGVLVKDQVHEVLKEKSAGTLFHGFTYSGHPTGAAVALKNLEIMEHEGIVENSELMGARLLKGFQEIKAASSIVGDVRAKGLLGAIEFVKDPATNERFEKELGVAPRIVAALHEKGVICRAVTYEQTDILCFSPPLIITAEEVDKMIAIVKEVVLEVQQQLTHEVAAK